MTRIVNRGIESSEKLRRYGCVVEFYHFRRLSAPYERRADIHKAFTTFAASLITLDQVKRFR